MTVGNWWPISVVKTPRLGEVSPLRMPIPFPLPAETTPESSSKAYLESETLHCFGSTSYRLTRLPFRKLQPLVLYPFRKKRPMERGPARNTKTFFHIFSTPAFTIRNYDCIIKRTAGRKTAPPMETLPERKSSACPGGWWSGWTGFGSGCGS